MVNDGDLVAIFQSIHRVMKAEQLLKGAGYAILLIPAPRSLAADCGLAIRYGEGERVEVEHALAEAGLLPTETFQRCGEGYRRVE